MQKAALLSVSEREGIEEFARDLTELGYKLLTTSGTGSYLQGCGIESISIGEYTGQPEILDGRVKTLHPKIHAGILARREVPEHIAELEENEIFSIEVVAVNLYPFRKQVHTRSKSSEEMVEFIDIGGPTMIRAAAKNMASVFAVIDPADYTAVRDALRDESSSAADLRRSLAAKVFAELADYNLQIAKYFSSEVEALPKYNGVVGSLSQLLRYGENPHQLGGYYRELHEAARWEQLWGKELSYNNLLDVDAADSLLRLVSSERATALIFKHLNPCGAARGSSQADALRRAKKSDPRSHFGGIIAFHSEVEEETAREIVKDFTEIVVAPAYKPAALEILQSKKNLRVIRSTETGREPMELRGLRDGVLIQESDSKVCRIESSMLVTSREPEEQELQDLQFAWELCAGVKSNAVVLVKEGQLLSSGAGQQSRIDSVETALQKANIHGHDLKGAVAASDAFFPFPDALEALAEAGVTAIAAPSGASKDEEVKQAAEKQKISLLFTSERHFRH